VKFSLYIAKRYLIAKKRHTAINIISIISIVGVAIGAFALIVILSVFNGFERLIEKSFNAFDPDLKISPKTGKVFIPDSVTFNKIYSLEEILNYSEIVEDIVLLRYSEYQQPATVKGVQDNYSEMTGVDTMMYDGEFTLWDKQHPQAIVGAGLRYYLSINLNFINPILMYAPKGNTMMIHEAFKRKAIFPSGVFMIERETDSKYVLVPLSFARDLFGYENQVTSIELQVNPGSNIKKLQKEIKEILGEDFHVKNRYEQKEFFYKVMRSEKWFISAILTFILLIASFNIIGSITMLIIDKKDDMTTLRSLGADKKIIRNIFLFEGWLICFTGTFAGLSLGTLLCYIQESYGIIKLKGANSFIVDAYPIDMQGSDILFILAVVSAIALLTTWYPVVRITKKHITDFI
jgi:lipoprotein-releasing system permease protein